jgi:hypothetical protein
MQAISGAPVLVDIVTLGSPKVFIPSPYVVPSPEKRGPHMFMGTTNPLAGAVFGAGP